MKKYLLQNYIFTLIICLICCSCASVFTKVVQYYPPKPADCDLDVYTTAEEIEKDYEVICILESQTGTSLFDDKSYQYAIERAKPKACKCGADAIFITSVQK